VLFFLGVLVQLVGLTRRAGHHSGWCGVVRVRLHALAQRVQCVRDIPNSRAKRAVGSPFAIPRRRSTRVAGRWRVFAKTVLVRSV
jgi:hypothetical protein